MIDVDEFGVVFREFAGDNIRERVCRIESRKYRNAEQNRMMMQTDKVVDGFKIGFSRIYDIVDFSFIHQFDDAVRSRQSVYDRNIESEFGNDLCPFLLWHTSYNRDRRTFWRWKRYRIYPDR